MHLSTKSPMHLTPQIDSYSSTPFTSGYGVVMEQEHELQSSTRKALEAIDGPRAAYVGRILRHQCTLLSENISRLEQLYESLPHADRFQALHRVLPPLSKTLHAAARPECPKLLPPLVTQHLNVTTNVDKLRAHPHDSQGDAYLVQVARNHDEMAWVLTSLIMEDETVRRRTVVPDNTSPTLETAEREWENEGGALRVKHPTGRVSVVESS